MLKKSMFYPNNYCGVEHQSVHYCAEHAQSKADFLNKANVALKEANEVLYWLMLLYDTDYVPDEEYKSIANDAEELIRMLASIVKTTKANLGK